MNTNLFKHFALKELNTIPLQIRSRGSEILSNSIIKNVSFNTTDSSGTFLVESSAKNMFYEVFLDYLEIENNLYAECDCPYCLINDDCEHIAAVLLFIIKTKEQSLLIEHNISYNGNLGFSATTLSNKFIQEVCSENSFLEGKKKSDKQNISLKEKKNGVFELFVEPEHTVKFNYQKGTDFINYSCTCNYPECEHMSASLLYLLKTEGKECFSKLHNWEDEKKQVAKKYGLSEKTASKLLSFSFKNQQLTYKFKGTKPSKLEETTNLKKFLEIKDSAFNSDMLKENYVVGYELVRFNQNSYDNADYYFKSLLMKIGKKGKPLKTGKIELEKAFDNKRFNFCADKKDIAIQNILNKQNSFYFTDSNISDAAKTYNWFKQIASLMIGKPTFISVENYHWQRPPSDQFQISESTVSCRISCIKENGLFKIRVSYMLNEKEIELNNKLFLDYLLVEHNSVAVPWKSIYYYVVAYFMRYKQELVLGDEIWPRFFNDNIKPLMKYIDIEIDKSIMDVKDRKEIAKPSERVILTEMGGFLLFYPVVEYAGIEANVLIDGANIVTDNNQLISRNKAMETQFLEFIANLHPNFNIETNQEFFHLSFDAVMEGFWFLEFYEECKKNNIELFGLDKLKNIKHSPVKPTVKYSVSSNTDWFDVNIEVDYEGAKISLKELRKAIINKSNLVQLGNGKHGILPEEWIKKISGTLKYGKIKDNVVELRKSQFALIDTLYEQIDDSKTLKELAENRVLLKGKNKITPVTLSKKFKGKLRDYQQEGVNWLSFINNLGFGGCLADDMGLGKTIQMLGFIQNTKETLGKEFNTCLVVCPTTLLFNWAQEIKKFSPKLKNTIHWGTNRSSKITDLKKNDIVITTYGTLTNDIELFRKIEFTLIILDESQAIKNPESLRYKAACVLKGRNRFVMTGTPIENNTIELYAQMNFINPGLLGSLNFFRKEFASSIDNNKDPEKINQLKHLVQPFLMRRRKEDVAKELPDKTEIVHICEMGEEQRKIYDAFKQDIRTKLLEKIDEDGLAKSRFSILEGLTKLRQLCNSPALLNTTEGYGDYSIKADELMLMLREKTKNHKVLIFSQFLGMLDIIEKRLIDEGIKFARLTGATRNRKEVVNSFENDDDCRVFLISLKAGGTGLNLISADYVFLVDPWWNPATENQAIDRTHRIGQTKKVFAYRMICKDTIEEKIIKLQERKKSLSDELISSSNGFVGQLTSEDIQDIFN